MTSPQRMHRRAAVLVPPSRSTSRTCRPEQRAHCTTFSFSCGGGRSLFRIPSVMPLTLKRRLTVNTVNRIRLYVESGIRDFLTAATTNTVRTLTQGCERLFDSTKFVDSAHLHGPGNIELIVCSCLIGGVGEEFRLCRDQVGHHGFVRKHRSKSGEFALKTGVLCTPPYRRARILRLDNS